MGKKEKTIAPTDVILLIPENAHIAFEETIVSVFAVF
jgi:hypothetical protein